MKKFLKIIFVIVVWALAIYLCFFDCSSDGLSLAVFPAAALIAAGSVLGAGALNLFSNSSANKSNAKLTREQMAWQSKENAKQREFQQSIYDQTNQYNTPAAQMSRLREAGLNPYLNQTEIGSMAQNAGAPSVGSAPSPIPQRPADFSFMAGAGSQMAALMQAENSAVSSTAQDRVSKAQAIKLYADAIHQLGGDFGDEAVQRVFKDTLPQVIGLSLDDGYNKRYVESMIENYKSQTRLTAINAKIQEEVGMDNAKFVLDNLHQAYVESTARVGLMAAQSELANSQGEYTIAKIKTLASEIARNFASAFKDSKLGNLLQSNKLQVDTVIKYLDSQLEMQLGEQAMQYLENYSTFKNREMIRSFKESKAGQIESMANDRFANFPAFRLIQEVNKSAEPALERISKMAPWHEYGNMSTTFEY